MAKIVRRKSPKMDEFLKAGNSGRLLGHVRRHMLSRPPEDRRSDILHPSSLCKDSWCARSAYFTITGEGAPAERNSLERQNIFDEGHFIHDKWQTRIREMGNLHGKWECRSCYHTWIDTSPGACVKCNHAYIVYREVPLSVPEWTVSGHADGWVKGLGDDFFIEIKSVGEGGVRFEAPGLLQQYGDAQGVWKNLKRPFTSHLKQGQFYLRLHNHANSKQPINEIVFIYEAKWNQQIKEFVVPYSPEYSQPMVDGALLVTAALKSGTPPECSHPGDDGFCADCRGL